MSRVASPPGAGAVCAEVHVRQRHVGAGAGGVVVHVVRVVPVHLDEVDRHVLAVPALRPQAVDAVRRGDLAVRRGDLREARARTGQRGGRPRGRQRRGVRLRGDAVAVEAGDGEHVARDLRRDDRHVRRVGREEGTALQAVRHERGLQQLPGHARRDVERQAGTRLAGLDLDVRAAEVGLELLQLLVAHAELLGEALGVLLGGLAGAELLPRRVADLQRHTDVQDLVRRDLAGHRRAQRLLGQAEVQWRELLGARRGRRRRLRGVPRPATSAQQRDCEQRAGECGSTIVHGYPVSSAVDFPVAHLGRAVSAGSARQRSRTGHAEVIPVAVRLRLVCVHRIP